jgi:uncharacterized Zn-binding protein involved in type VI secretion
MKRAIIRQGDPTSHGGRVIEGSLVDLCEGKPIAFVGHKVSCCKCKGIYEIIEGAPTTTFYGKGVALEGMRTSCGATLIATQFVTTVEIASSGSISGGSGKASSPVEQESVPKFYQTTEGEWLLKFGPEHFTEESPNEQVRAFDAKTGKPIPELAYYIEAPDGSTYTGHTDVDGLCERVTTYQPEVLAVWLGEDAEKKMQGA